MNPYSERYDMYVETLREDLLPALGCTEPVAIALAVARARQELSAFPQKIMVLASGNIIKNVMGVIVPTTGNLRGIEASAILGALAGNPDKELEVLEDVTPEDIKQLRQLLKTPLCEVKLLKSDSTLHIIVTASAGDDTVTVEIKDKHNRFTRIEKNGSLIYCAEDYKQNECHSPNLYSMNLAEIYDFALSVDIGDIHSIISRQIKYNSAVAEEGLSNEYGANVGVTLVQCYGSDIKVMARAYPAAGSDARMSGCVMPVVTNSGSGNQGMTVSLPVIQYANYLKVSEEQLYRALVLSNLTAIYQKTAIGSLSAYCGAVSAACGSGAGIAYLQGGNFELIADTVTNTLANISGMVCDGAKPSCAAKIASAVEAALLGYHMAACKRVFHSGEGIVKNDVEQTIQSIARMASKGMRQTDEVILQIMVDEA